MGAVGFGIYKGYNMYKNNTKSSSYFTAWIGLTEKTKSELEQYKDSKWSWDEFMKRLLILIKKDAEDEK